MKLPIFAVNITFYFYAIDITECYNNNEDNNSFNKYLKDNKFITHHTNKGKILINLADTYSNMNKEPNMVFSAILAVIGIWFFIYGGLLENT